MICDGAVYTAREPRALVRVMDSLGGASGISSLIPEICRVGARATQTPCVRARANRCCLERKRRRRHELVAQAASPCREEKAAA